MLLERDGGGGVSKVQVLEICGREILGLCGVVRQRKVKREDGSLRDLVKCLTQVESLPLIPRQKR